MFALIFLFLFLRTLSIPSGGGEMKNSPNGKFVAVANSLKNDNPISPDSKTAYCEFTVSEGHGIPPFKRVLVFHLETNDEMYFRELPQIITWETNSSGVTFSTPKIVIKLNF